MRRFYLIKKDPAKNDSNNWMIMNYPQYEKWLKTPEGKARNITNFGVLKGFDESDIEYYIECDEEARLKMKSEQNHTDYLRRMWNESGYELISYNVSPVIDDEEMTGEELLPDEDCDVEEIVLKNCLKEKLHKALTLLNDDERAVIYNEFFAQNKLSQKSLGQLLGKTERQIGYLLTVSLDKLKYFLERI